jgi:hypothetical protein
MEPKSQMPLDVSIPTWINRALMLLECMLLSQIDENLDMAIWAWSPTYNIDHYFSYEYACKNL